MEEKDGKESQAMKEIAEIGSAGFASGLVLAIFVLGGYYLDSKLEWSPVLTITGIVFGVVGSFYTLIRSVTKKNGKE